MCPQAAGGPLQMAFLLRRQDAGVPGVHGLYRQFQDLHKLHSGQKDAEKSQ